MISYENFLNIFNVASSLISPLYYNPFQAPFHGNGEVNATTQWSLSDTYIGSSFFSGFDHEAISDPTHGRVK